MTKSLGASAQGLKIVDEARRKKGWNKVDENWWKQAHTTKSTLKRFWNGTPIRPDTFIAICEVIEVDWEEILDDNPPPPPHHRRQDWGEAPDVSVFFGRTEELATLEQWIAQDRCRLVAISGMGGIGKKYLAAQLAQQIQNQFEYLIWRSLRNAPPVEDLLASLLQFLYQQEETDLPATKADRILRLIEHLWEHRCLLILDDWEMVLRGEELTGQYLPGYEGYGELLKLLGESRHKSCLLIATREKPQEIPSLAGVPVRYLELSGLQQEAAQKLLLATGLEDLSNNVLSELMQQNGGNPAVLKMIADQIKEVYDGKVVNYLQESTLILGNVLTNFLSQQFERLSALEKDIVYWLAIAGQPLSLSQLRDDLGVGAELVEALLSLKGRSLVKKTPDGSECGFQLEPVVRKYAIRKLREKFTESLFAFARSREIAKLGILKSHALVTAGSDPDRVKTNLRLLVQPIKDKLSQELSGDRSLEAQLEGMRVRLEGRSAQEVGYATRNVTILLGRTSEWMQEP
ncbi:MAG: NB-ARC domain-containing protein [Hormoscilla sp.]